MDIKRTYWKTCRTAPIESILLLHPSSGIFRGSPVFYPVQRHRRFRPGRHGQRPLARNPQRLPYPERISIWIYPAVFHAAAPRSPQLRRAVQPSVRLGKRRRPSGRSAARVQAWGHVSVRKAVLPVSRKHKIRYSCSRRLQIGYHGWRGRQPVRVCIQYRSNGRVGLKNCQNETDFVAVNMK